MGIKARARRKFHQIGNQRLTFGLEAKNENPARPRNIIQHIINEKCIIDYSLPPSHVFASSFSFIFFLSLFALPEERWWWRERCQRYRCGWAALQPRRLLFPGQWPPAHSRWRTPVPLRGCGGALSRGSARSQDADATAPTPGTKVHHPFPPPRHRQMMKPVSFFNCFVLLIALPHKGRVHKKLTFFAMLSKTSHKHA